MSQNHNSRNPWAWIPSLYFMEGMPYIIVALVSGIMFARMGVSNAEMALYTAWFNLPWMIKPFWSPLVELYRSQRFWILAMQVLIGAGFAGVALVLPTDNFFRYSLAFFWLVAFSSATHDIAIDGFYLSNLDANKQAFFVGIRSTFYRLAMIAGQGFLLIFAGYLEGVTGLGTHEINVQSSIENQANINFIKLDNNTKSDELQFIWTDKKIEVFTQNITVKLADSTINFARTNNSEANFYETEEKSTNSADFVGNLAVVPFRISAPPEEPVIVNLDWYSGDKSLKLIEGKRFVFTKENWDKTAYLVFQADTRLTSETEAIFRATSGNVPLAWSLTFMVLSGFMGISFLYHNFTLPKNQPEKIAENQPEKSFGEILQTFITFFQKRDIIITVAFLIFYRFGETQLSKLTAPFMVDSREVGGLAMTTGEVGWIYGTVGVLSLTFGGLLGGWLVSKYGLKKWLWAMVIAINLPNAVYVYLSYSMPESLWLITACVSVEQFGYGFGFTAYMMYMLYISKGKYETAHYAIATGLMALGRMFAEMISGTIQEILGYQDFFVWVLIATIPCFVVSALIRFDKSFGKKSV